jgi:hypothetical protein
VSLRFIDSHCSIGQAYKEAIPLKVDVYEHLLQINVAFDQVVRCLAALQKRRQFGVGELDRFRRQSKETRASVNSYLMAIIESAESDEAGRRFHKRIAQEKNDEEGGPDV